MKIKPSDVKIGTSLYQYSSKIMEYRVVGINQLEYDTHIEKFYIIECQSCTDHEKCKVAVKFDDYGDIVYSHMVNNYEEYDEETERTKNSQYYWHKNDEYHWFTTRKDARLFVHNKNISYFESEITKSQENIERLKKEIEKEKDKISALTE